MAWTNEQIKAIETRNSNILVSAGAGSGKTAVLSERVLEFVKAGNSVKDLLVLTFTRASALEMKVRIYKKLKEAGLFEEADLTLKADITTFDSYALSLVKRYYYYLDIDTNIGIADQNILNAEKRKIINEIFLDLYEKEDKTFENFLIRENVKDDKGIIETILDLSNKIELLVDPVTYLNNYLDNYYDDENINKLVQEYSNILVSKVKNINILLEELNSIIKYTGNEKLEEYIDILMSKIDNIKDYDEILPSLVDFKFPQLKRGSGEEISSLKDSVNTKIKDIINSVSLYPNKLSLKEEILSTKSDISFLISILLKLIDRLDKYKKKYSLYTYNDIAKMAIKLVRDFKDVRKELLKIKEILVDEYQDTSDIQETFLSYITCDNLYMVGDIKQSIYRFRNANPYIFKDKYERYKNGNGGIKIDLLKNFRSRKEVLSGINLIFESLMTSDFGDCDYKNDGAMVYGLTSYDDVNKNDYNLEVLSYDKDSIEGYKTEEIEIFICANKVKELVENNYTFSDGKARKTKYSDIAIIIDKSTNFPLFKKIFEYLGIPLSIERDLDIKDNSLTQTIVSILQVFLYLKYNEDNNHKLYLTSFLRSFIVAMPDEEIYDVITNKKYDIDILNKLKDIDITKDSFSIYYDIINAIDLYAKLPLIGNVKNSLVIIDYVAGLIESYSKLGYDFKNSVLFLGDILTSEAKLNYKNESKGDDEVKLMTIHHSKGLEYPYCIFPLLNTKLNESDTSKKFNFSNKYGFYVKNAQNVDYSVVSLLEKENFRKEEISERVRVLYVALTRAREKMILLLDNKDKANLLRQDIKTFKDMLVYTNTIDKFIKDVDLDKLGLTKDYNISRSNDIAKNVGIKIKYSDNDYQEGMLEKGKISKENINLIDDNTRYILNLGTNIHEILATLNLKNPDLTNIPINYKDKIEKILALDIFKDIEKAKIYQEYEFYYEDGNNSYYGIIDLLLEYSNHFVIIDYKLADLSKEEYERQLGVYYNYIKSISDKDISVYLLSIMRSEVRKIEY